MNKKVVLLLLLVVVAGAAFFLGTGERTLETASVSAPATSVKRPLPGRGSDPGAHSGGHDSAGMSDQTKGATGERPAAGEEELEDDEFEDISAAEKYKSAEEALAAVKAGAIDYDDDILNYFLEPGADCSWCGEFYTNIKGELGKSDLDEDTRGYYAEILAISGNKENIETLVESIKTAPNEDTRDIVAESLELAIGGDDVVEYLADYMNDSNETLQEASIAAISNQGSRLSAEILYNHARSTGDPNGSYDLGIGLGELVPEEEALPFLHEVVLQRDEFSHLAVKALLNSGLPGLTIVVDVLSNPKDKKVDTSMLVDAEDHVIYDEEVKTYLEKISNKSNVPHLVQFAKNVLSDFEEEELEDEDLFDDEDIA